jgi:haloacetate dehalogenase
MGISVQWRKVSNQVDGRALPSGHYIPEQVPEILLEEVNTFWGING